ncbi:class I SAM-dependent methyltransferase [Mesorhizobium sp. ZC-5]|uniref:class I SAM-dependent methyltransferase n=1 Tax=Mesorhizobium sp. ZC-5 TaxID=2986066 RepID=UPI0021E85579|nr:class I SAM-dependent methyltransferase [Mesorhizobium sp. ZC-5]MCV3239808.1 class I SAM-dependent methyltransferase [Mesorhizobium sp. ZC-5]
MTHEALKTLFHPLETGEIALPNPGDRVLFLGTEPGFRLTTGFQADLALVQGFRPDYRSLLASGFRVTPTPEGDGFDAALVLVGRHRGQNENRIADAIERVNSDGLIVVAGSKEDGIASLRKRVAGLMELEGQMPKYHGIAFWLRRPEDAAQILAALREGNGETLVEGRFRTMPGMFSHDRIDTGSELLAENLPADLSGKVADFCAGWGYLAAEVLRRAPGVKQIDLYEADFASLEAAKLNLAEAGHSAARNFFWHDLLGEKVAEHYDAIVMNPPFHKARAADPLIGQGMIKAAAAALRRGGRLLMVANTALPYEAVLNGQFGGHKEIARDGGFKVLSATR